MLSRLNEKMLKILSQKRNELLYRDEISAIKEDLKAPSMSEAKLEIAEILKKEAEMVVIKRIKGRFGSQQFAIEACVYDSKEAMNKIEPKPKEKKAAAGQETSEQAAKK